MINHIRALAPEVVNKIAAGEVIERPASIVKELVENALDAQADHLVIEIKGGGKQLIRVIDNGTGIMSEDLSLVFERYATSKIKEAEDLEKITSLGFRGEALPSIAAVSKIKLFTKTKGSMEGYQLSSRGGLDERIQEAGCPEGTQIDVEDLFFNTPARRKFLKSNATEMDHILKLVESLAFAFHKVAFKLIGENKELINTAKNDNLNQRLISLYGKQIGENLKYVDFSNSFLNIEGFVSHPALTYANKNRQLIFVNNRLINSRLISHAIYGAYNNIIPPRRYPAVFLFIKIEPSLIDVNVHPAKSEIRFINEQGIHSLVAELIKKFLKGEATSYLPGNEAPMDSQKEKIKESIADYLSKPSQPQRHFFSGKTYFDKNINIEDLSKPRKFSYSNSSERKENILFDSAIEPLAQIAGKYILAQKEGNLVVIDQHAASERIVYECFKEELSKDKVSVQALLIPITLELSSSQTLVVKENISYLNKIGFIVEEFGHNTFVAKGIPAILGEKNNERIVLDVLDALSELGTTKKEIAVTDEISDHIIKVACHTAIRANDHLEKKEIEVLIENLKGTKNPFTCPHGRPTMIEITKEELDRRFKRT